MCWVLLVPLTQLMVNEEAAEAAVLSSMVTVDGIWAFIHLTVTNIEGTKFIVKTTAHFCNKTGALNNTAKTPANSQGIWVTLNPYHTAQRLWTIFNNKKYKNQITDILDFREENIFEMSIQWYVMWCPFWALKMK